MIVHSRGNVGPSFGGVLCRLRAKMKRWCPANVGQGPSKSAGALSLAEARWRCGKAIDHAANLREELFLSRWCPPLWWRGGAILRGSLEAASPGTSGWNLTLGARV